VKGTGMFLELVEALAMDGSRETKITVSITVIDDR